MRRAPAAVALAALLATSLATAVGAQGTAGGEFALRHPLRAGTLIVDGGGSISSQQSPGQEERLTSVVLSPRVSRFLSPRWALGTSVLLQYAGGNGNQTTVGIGPVVHYYFAGAPARLLPFVSATTRLQRSRYTNGDFESTQTTVGFEGDVGATYLLVPAVGLSGSLYGQYVRSRQEADLSEGARTVFRTDAFGARVGVTVFVR